eukprot:GAHX01001714.1.p2 GENE.GAHX01001714.1~~GAHX01001714.1.p2  ORF type:complete len:653 (+),score=137.36 GAHX01001714.1:133-1959(+)
MAWEEEQGLQFLFEEAATENSGDLFKTIIDLVNDNILYAPIIVRNLSLIFHNADSRKTFEGDFISNMEQYTKSLLEITNICKFDAFMILISELVNHLILDTDCYLKFISSLLSIQNNAYLRPMLYCLFNCINTLNKLGSVVNEQGESIRKSLSKVSNALKEIDLNSEQTIVLKATEDTTLKLETYAKMLLEKIIKDLVVLCKEGDGNNTKDETETETKKENRIQQSIFNSFHVDCLPLDPILVIDLASAIENDKEGDFKIIPYPSLISSWEETNLRYIQIVNLLIHQTAGKQFKPKVLFAYSFNNVDDYKSDSRIDLTAKVVFSLIYAPNSDGEELLDKSYYEYLAGKCFYFKNYLLSQFSRLIKYMVIETVLKSLKMYQIVNILDFTVHIFLLSNSAMLFQFIRKKDETPLSNVFYEIVLKKAHTLVNVKETRNFAEFNISDNAMFEGIRKDADYNEYNEKILMKDKEIEPDKNTLLFELVRKSHEGGEFILYTQCLNIVKAKDEIKKWREVEGTVEVVFKYLWDSLKDNLFKEVLIIFVNLIETEIITSEELVDFTKKKIAVLKEGKEINMHFVLAIQSLSELALKYTDDENIKECEEIFRKNFDF